MKKTKLINQMIKAHKEKEFNKGKYTIQNLFVAKIQNPCRHNIIPMKDFAICAYDPNWDSLFRAINSSNLPCDYVLANITPFHTFMEEYMKANSLTNTDKLSLKQIYEIEQNLNKNQEFTIISN